MKRIIVLLCTALFLSVCCFAEEFDGYVVKLRDNTAQIFSDSVSYSDEASLFSEMDDADFAEFLTQEVPGVQEVASRYNLVKAADEETLNELVSLGLVEYFEENIYYDLYGYDVEANPKLSEQWYIGATNADFAWDAGIYGSGVNVAVIDSGVYKHPDLLSNLIDGINYCETDKYTCNNDTAKDGHGHGTAVAGVIAAVCNNKGPVGVAFKSKIVPFRVINSQGRISLTDAVKAIDDAINTYGCKVINMSFGSTGESRALYSAILEAINKGVIVVAASGNIDDNGTVPRYPAYHPEVISVANAAQSGASYVISSTSISNEMVDIAAPGKSIYSTYVADNVYAKYSGTSFAAPVVSAAAALAKSVNPDITQSEFEALIKSTANSSYIASSGQNSNYWGAGLLDIEKMLKTMLAGQEYYISDVHTTNNESFFCVTNMTNNAIDDCSLVISEGNKSKRLTFSLEASESVEISLNDEGFTKNAVVIKSSRIRGDINNDGTVNIRDASVILRYNAGYSVDVGVDILDVNGDGTVNIRDASMILRYCAGYEI